ncbi:matrix protein [Wuhan Louse Fly Virus 9]|uniref:Matrix protein n=1 Tax=Wuhan Louse Fly Virus 9 TaxID=1608123 RepID=A0A0B5KKB5_9RHAB|nr:matrix protein [Wuhan Louse Fly Virus 9]AJG39205.1 matrix protein [Wuhan Louse Fly Virus 9]
MRMKKVKNLVSPRRKAKSDESNQASAVITPTAPSPSSTTPFSVPTIQPNIVPSIITSRWNTVGSLRISCEREITDWVTMERLLEYMLDFYDGNEVFKPVILMLYWILGVHLKPVEGPSNRWCWGIDFGEPIEVKHKFPLIGSQSFDYRKNITSNYRGIKFNIEFWIQFTGTQRRSTPVKDLLGVGSLIFPDVRRFKEILDFSNINCELDSNKNLVLTQ